MIQFNLLPDIKVQYLKARHQKRLFMLSSTIAIIVTVTVLVLLVSFVFGVQKKSINDLSKDIDKAESALQSTPDLNKILTVQNQLKSITGLHDEKAVASRLFGYLSQITPADASIARINIDFVESTMTISGSAKSLEVVNIFADTLKFTNYTTDTNKEETPAFSEVVLTNFGRDNKIATYTIASKFDPIIFSELENVTLTVPNIVTTRSEVAQPTALFQKQEETTGTEQ